MSKPRRRQHQPEGVLGDRGGVQPGQGFHRHAAGGGGVEVDVVGARANPQYVAELRGRLERRGGKRLEAHHQAADGGQDLLPGRVVAAQGLIAREVEHDLQASLVQLGHRVGVRPQDPGQHGDPAACHRRSRAGRSGLPRRRARAHMYPSARSMA
jgi:hypothetical protein